MARPWIQDHKRSEMRDKTYQRPVVEMLKLILQNFFCRKGPRQISNEKVEVFRN